MAKRSGMTRAEPALGWRAWTGPAAPMRRAHRHDDLELNHMRRGWYRYLVGGELVTLTEGRTLALWGAFPHQSVARSADAAMCWATLPLTDAMAMGLPEPLMGRLLTRGCVLDGEARPGDEPTFLRWARDLGGGRPTGRAGATPDPVARPGGRPRAPESRHIVALEVEARLRRLATAMAPTHAADDGDGEAPAPSVDGGGGGDGEGERGAFGHVARMARLIADRYREPLRVEQVAASVGLNPSYAMTLFRRRTGATINQYLNRQRVAHAQRLLVTGDTGVTEIALDAGFGSMSRFYEAFNEATGMSPRAFRRRMRSG